MRRSAAACACAIACNAAPAAPREPAPAPEPARSPGRVLRAVSAGAVTIGDDWAGTQGGFVFPPVRDGQPDQPAVVAGAIAFAVPGDASGHKQRVEWKLLPAADRDGLHFDNARYVGFDFTVQAPAEPFLGSAIFFQAWQGFPFGPPVSLKITRGDAPPFRVELAIRNVDTGPSSEVPDREVWSARRIEPGRTYRFVIYIAPRQTGSGALRLWIDGERVVDWRGAIGYVHDGDRRGLDLKLGIYQPNANRGHTFRFDRVVAATSYTLAAGSR